MKVFNFPFNFFHWKVLKENSIYMFIYNKRMLHSEVRCYAISINTLIRDILSFANCKYKLRWMCTGPFLFYRLLRRDKVRPPTEPHYNNSTQLRKKEHHKHVKMFLLGRNESVGMYPRINLRPFLFVSSNYHGVSIPYGFPLREQHCVFKAIWL